jgi:hypothetical protein
VAASVQLDRGVRLVLGDRCIVGKSRRGSRQVGQHAGQLTRKVAWVAYPAFEPQPPVVIAVEVAWVERQHPDQTISVVRLVA